ncbi:MAG TPA: hypothetical protein VMI06_08660 [Terriglobia bacterium]|nr:hypothetical protein [Terriglobia bacterium]
MRRGLPIMFAGLALAGMPWASASAQDMSMNAPQTIVASSAFAIQSAGSGTATLYIVGPDRVLKRRIQLGETTSFPSGSLNNAGHYLVVLAAGSSTQSASLDVIPESTPATIAFLAKPSRLPVSLNDAITGAVYLFDANRNLIAAPTPVSFELSGPSGGTQTHSTTTRDGAAWTEINSTAQQGVDNFVAKSDGVSIARQIRQVPGDPCNLTMTAQKAGSEIELQTAPVRDCSGNVAADGTIVTFTETYDGGQSTADVPLKHGVAKVEMPAYSGATLSVASGVVLGNQIRWEE